MLITFEGIDGCGKSTQIGMLVSWFESQGVACEAFREPGGIEVSEKIRDLLLHTNSDIDPVTELLLFSAARSQLVAERVQPLLQEGVTVILDRFFDSTTAYQGYGRSALPIEDVHFLNRIASHSLLPDLTFYLRIDYRESIERTAGTQMDRMEQSGELFFQRVIEGYEEIARQNRRVQVLNALESPSMIHEKIIDHVHRLITR